MVKVFLVIIIHGHVCVVGLGRLSKKPNAENGRRSTRQFDAASQAHGWQCSLSLPNSPLTRYSTAAPAANQREAQPATSHVLLCPLPLRF